jgi:AcrR family transcriptional regulator
MAADQEAFGRAGSGARPAGRGQRRAGRRKVAVLEAAGRVIAARGADATRFADVAAESGVPVSTLQYYFGSREDLLVAAFRHASGTEIAALEADLAGLDDPWEQLAHVVTSALRGYQADAGAAGARAKATGAGAKATGAGAKATGAGAKATGAGAGATGAGATGAAGSGRLWIESWHFGIRDAEMRADALRDYGAWRELVADVVRRGTEAGTFAPRLSPEQVAVLTIALVDGVGIPLALDDPAITPDGAVADVLSALAGLLHPPAAPA